MFLGVKDFLYTAQEGLGAENVLVQEYYPATPSATLHICAARQLPLVMDRSAPDDQARSNATPRLPDYGAHHDNQETLFHGCQCNTLPALHDEVPLPRTRQTSSLRLRYPSTRVRLDIDSFALKRGSSLAHHGKEM